MVDLLIIFSFWWATRTRVGGHRKDHICSYSSTHIQIHIHIQRLKVWSKGIFTFNKRISQWHNNLIITVEYLNCIDDPNQLKYVKYALLNPTHSEYRCIVSLFHCIIVWCVQPLINHAEYTIFEAYPTLMNTRRKAQVDRVCNSQMCQRHKLA